MTTEVLAAAKYQLGKIVPFPRHKHDDHYNLTDKGKATVQWVESADLKDFPIYSGTVYLAGPIVGLSYQDARYGWRKYVADRLPPEIICLSPMRHEGHLVQETLIDDRKLPEHTFSEPRVIVAKDKLDIMRSDIVLVNFLEAKVVSKGTLVEMGIAHAMEKTIIVAMEDEGNPHDSVFVSGLSLIVPTLDEAIAMTASLLSEGI